MAQHPDIWILLQICQHQFLLGLSLSGRTVIYPGSILSDAANPGNMDGIGITDMNGAVDKWEYSVGYRLVIVQPLGDTGFVD